MGNPDHLHVRRRTMTHYGSLEKFIRGLRAGNPLDLSAANWKARNPRGTFEEWRALARAHLQTHLHYHPGPPDLQAETLRKVDRGDFTLEFVAFNTSPWSRVNGCLLLPKVSHPVPGLVVFHAWGGPLCWGKERIVDTGRDHPSLRNFREIAYGGRYLADEFARRGYGVIVIDAHHFGERAPRGRSDVDQEIDPLQGIPDQWDAFDMTEAEVEKLHAILCEKLYLGVRELNWAGTTWAGVNFGDDSRCLDYLESRPEIDSNRMGCTGLSGGGWRTNMLAALDPRIKASVSVGWMTTGDYQQVFDVHGTVGAFCLLPGVWNRMDVPDLTIMSAPCASMVVVGREDDHFPVEAQDAAHAVIRAGYEWAGQSENFRFYNPPKPHSYDLDIQKAAFDWFSRHLHI